MNAFYKPLIFILTLLLVGFIYFCGIEGPFLYDDIANLSTLHLLNDNFSYQAILNFILSNSSGPLGRPVAMTSFLMNSQTWPTSPVDFKITNIIIHLICGIFIFLFIQKLLPMLESEIKAERVYILAFITTSFWLIHPLHVSTTLYVVQRMTQLSSLFSLLSLIAYLKFQPILQTKNDIKSFVWPSIVLICTISLAIFSKENAILIFPTLILIYFLTNKKATVNFKIWFYGLTIFPIIASLYKLMGNPDIYESAFFYKGFTLSERLLSELRIIFDYLIQIISPNSSSMTIFHDDFVISTSLTSPISTLFSLGLLIGLISLLFLRIKSIYKFSIAWFLIWHILESTALPLDLYFEHRNYLASLGPLLAITYALFHTSDKLGSKYVKLPYIFALIFSSFLTVQLATLTKIWGDEETLLIHWLSNHEKSKNTLISLVQYYEKQKALPLAHNITLKAAKYEHFENDLGLHMKLYIQQCVLNKSNENTLSKLKRLSLDPSSFSHTVITMNASIVLNILSSDCKPADIKGLHQVLHQIETYSPQNTSVRWRRDIQSKHAFLYLHYNQLKEALTLFKKSYNYRTPDIAIAIIDINIKLSDYTSAQNWINVALKNSINNNYWTKTNSTDIKILQKRLNEVDHL